MFEGGVEGPVCLERRGKGSGHSPGVVVLRDVGEGCGVRGRGRDLCGDCGEGLIVVERSEVGGQIHIMEACTVVSRPGRFQGRVGCAQRHEISARSAYSTHACACKAILAPVEVNPTVHAHEHTASFVCKQVHGRLLPCSPLALVPCALLPERAVPRSTPRKPSWPENKRASSLDCRQRQTTPMNPCQLRWDCDPNDSMLGAHTQLHRSKAYQQTAHVRSTHTRALLHTSTKKQTHLERRYPQLPTPLLNAPQQPGSFRSYLLQCRLVARCCRMLHLRRQLSCPQSRLVDALSYQPVEG